MFYNNNKNGCSSECAIIIDLKPLRTCDIHAFIFEKKANSKLFMSTMSSPLRAFFCFGVGAKRKIVGN